MSVVDPASTAKSLLDMLRDGNLAGVSHTLADRLRQAPGDAAARMFFFQLCCVQGQWEKARRSVDTLAAIAPEARMLAVAYGQALTAEARRGESCRDSKAMDLLEEGPDWLADLSRAFAEDAEAAAITRTRAFAAAPDTPGDVDGRPFDYLFDGDERFGPSFEAIIAGRWGLLPFSAIEEIATEGPRDLRDLVWLPVQLRLRSGGSAAALLPVRYPGTELLTDDSLRLARRTDWRQQGGVSTGLGQRVWTTSTEEDVGILSFRRIRFVART